MTTITAYIRTGTSETAPAHLISTAEDGRKLYQAIDGYEPNVPYDTDADGNWMPKKQISYTAYCGRKELLTSNSFADAGTAAEQCLVTSPAPLVHIRRDSDAKSVIASVALDYHAANWTPEEIYDLLGRDMDGEAL